MPSRGRTFGSSHHPEDQRRPWPILPITDNAMGSGDICLPGTRQARAQAYDADCLARVMLLPRWPAAPPLATRFFNNLQ